MVAVEAMASEADVKCAVRRLMVESRHAVSRSEISPEVTQALDRVSALLPCHSDHSAKNLGLTHSLPELRQEFLSDHYSDWLHYLVAHFTVDWMKCIPPGKVEKLVDTFFMDGTHHEAFLVLTDSVRDAGGGYQLHKCVSLIESFLKQHKLQQVMWSQCQVQSSRGGMDPMTSELWWRLSTQIVSLPDNILAKLHSDVSELFYPKDYTALVVQEMYQVLKMVKCNIARNQDCSVQFLSQLFGRLCLTGHADSVWSAFLPSVMPLLRQDYVWCRVCERLVTGVPDRCMESTVLALLKHSSHHSIVSKLLGHSVLNNAKLQYLLTNKLLLLRHFNKDIILQNILGYLSLSPVTRHLLNKVWLTLLDVWGDSSAVKHTSYEQHLYITKALLVCLAFLTDEARMELRQKTLSKLMSGIQCHLDSPIVRVRRLGMIVAEQITGAVGPIAQKLQFEYERDEEVENLVSLVLPPSECSESDISQKLEAASLDDIKPSAAAKPLLDETVKAESSLDSDDDLEPYDLSNDVKFSKVKPPVYLRDCMEGLLSSEDPDRVEGCLSVAEKLIRKHATTVSEVAVEFAKILLHLQDVEGFTERASYRFSAMVALAVTAPQPVAAYLIGEFYHRNYNIRQRMDILEVLAAAAQELAHPSSKRSSPPASPAIVSPLQANPATGTENWRDIVQQRIEKKTRHFTKGKQRPEAKPIANRFAPVAGMFFFPLLRDFDRRDVGWELDLLGEDHLVLSRLTYTLGVVCYAAVNAPVLIQIAKALLEYIWTLHGHPQPSVRRALLFAVCMVLLAVPSYLLVSDLQADIAEVKAWLAEVVEGDVDEECKRMALQALILLEDAVKKQFENI